MEVLGNDFQQKTILSLEGAIEDIKKQFKINFSKNEKIAIALSGGIDSLSLTFALKKFNIIALHFNHSIRKQSDDEEEYLKQLMQSNEIHFISQKWHGEFLKNENLAREKRYEFLKTICNQMNIKFILTAHHADDQLETFFMNLSRGSSLDGLTGMKNFTLLQSKNNLNNEIFLIRPLLKISKEECINFIKLQQIQHCEDDSNQDKKFLRNNIRNLLQQIGDYSLIKRRILQTVENLQCARLLIEKNINKTINSLQKIEKQLQPDVEKNKIKFKEKNIKNYIIISLIKFIKLTTYEKYHILNHFINLFEQKPHKIRKSFLEELINDIENNLRTKKIIKRNLKNTNIVINCNQKLMGFFKVKNSSST